MTAISAGARLDEIATLHHAIEERVQLAAVDALRELAANAHRDAAFFSMVDSDQGPYLTGSHVYDADGHQIDLDAEFTGDMFDDEGRGSWLVDGGHWASEVVTIDRLPATHEAHPRESWFAVDPTRRGDATGCSVHGIGVCDCPKSCGAADPERRPDARARLV